MNNDNFGQYTHEQLMAIIQACFKTQVVTFDNYALVILKKKEEAVSPDQITAEIEKADE